MHGLINRSLESFLRDTYGAALWAWVAEAAGVAPEGFESMRIYDPALTDHVLAAASERLAKPRDALLEDLGMYLVGLEPLRRLLRFGGVSYIDFLQSLDELPDRARMAVADIGLPDMELLARSDGCFALMVSDGHPGFRPVFAGILRAMADDYGAFALVDLEPTGDIRIELLEAQFQEGRAFDLARPEVG